ncbi:MAG TPA: HXXEE domain-containing protein [Vicinamibacterales bacterium]|nr:HXXEE domain-containing protein [Vicinamibacterales bacterium]
MRSNPQFGRAWLALAIALGLHVLDETLTDFLSVYNPIVRQARERWGWFPMPEFTFGVWLGGLCLLVTVLLLLTPLAYRGSRALRIFAYPYGVIMFLNGVGHLVGSIYLGRWAPGATTAPILLATSSWLLRETIKASAKHSPKLDHSW